MLGYFKNEFNSRVQYCQENNDSQAAKNEEPVFLNNSKDLLHGLIALFHKGVDILIF